MGLYGFSTEIMNGKRSDWSAILRPLTMATICTGALGSCRRRGAPGAMAWANMTSSWASSDFSMWKRSGSPAVAGRLEANGDGQLAKWRRV